jgi:hypothetical protein
MATDREKSDGRVVSEGARKTASTAALQRGEKAATANEQATKLDMLHETADSPKGADEAVDADRSASGAHVVPKSRSTENEALPAITIEEVASEQNLRKAFQKVASNKGAPGPDRRSVSDVRKPSAVAGEVGAEDRRSEALDLIRRMLKAKVVMPDGVVVSTDEGVPQGGPLSPLLSNIVLDELDRELEQRGHRFVRYADDCNIYVSSERAGKRVMAGIVRFIERRLRLKVNAEKSAVSRPEKRHFVGFSLWREPQVGRVEVLLSLRSRRRIAEKIRELTPGRWGQSIEDCIKNINQYLLGWIGFFHICTESSLQRLKFLDAHIRRRLRAIVLRHWRRRRDPLFRFRPGHVSWWRLSITKRAHRVLPNAFFAQRKLLSLELEWQRFRSPSRRIASASL